MKDFVINQRKLGRGEPAYFIADIAANHDGSLERAKDLIRLAKDAGADAAKFQHFRAETIVSRHGFEGMGRQLSHQASWKKSVFEVYQGASVPLEWTEELVKTADEVGIDFFTSPYDLDVVDAIDPYVPAYKIGSGDITWSMMLEKIASKGKPVLLASGASTLDDVQRAMDVLRQYDIPILLMQCNTNYTASLENFKYVRLKVLQTFASMYPSIALGLSDHTPGHSTVLGSIALGACAIEKHFTDDVGREGPDHKFSMDPVTWREMVDRSRELEAALGDGEKRVEDNEKETVILQRRCARAAADLPEGTVLSGEHVTVLRPAQSGAILPYEVEGVLGRRLRRAIKSGDALSLGDFE